MTVHNSPNLLEIPRDPSDVHGSTDQPVFVFSGMFLRSRFHTRDSFGGMEYDSGRGDGQMAMPF